MSVLNEHEQELLDLLALGALDDEERKIAEDLISKNELAREYFDESLETISMLEDNTSSNELLLQRIHNEINEKKSKDKRSFIIPFISGAIAASILAAIISVAIWPSGDDKSNQAFSLSNQVATFESQENVVKLPLESKTGDKAISLMSHNGDIMIDARAIKELDKEHTYQLWAIIESATGQQVISAGVLGNGPGVYMTHVNGNVAMFALTKEVSGGVEKSTQLPMYVGKTFSS